jgi:hypothetical protein
VLVTKTFLPPQRVQSCCLFGRCWVAYKRNFALMARVWATKVLYGSVGVNDMSVDLMTIFKMEATEKLGMDLCLQ